MKTKFIIGSLAAVIIVSAAFKLRSNKHTVEENVFRPDANKTVPVQTAAVETKALSKTINYTGTFAPNREVLMIPQVHGQVTGVYFNEGDFVAKGKLLVQIDDDLVQAQHGAAVSNYETAKRNLSRYENASVSGGVSQAQLDNLKLNFSNAEAQLKQLRKQIELAKISAPFAGTITLRDVEPGSVVGNGVVARITDLTQLKLEISVPEKEVNFFREGETVEITTDIYPSKKIVGKVEHVADIGDPAHNYLVRLLVRNSNPSVILKAGMYGTTMLKTGSDKNGLFIPRAALLGSAKNPQVFVVKSGKASLKQIRTGFAIDDSIEVLAGLTEGEIVVTTGHINLADGSNVTVVK